jgi:hypothetical protein
MIRRQMADQFWMITQQDHALLAGRLAEAWGNHRFARLDPDRQESVIRGIALHDCGWPAHDERPTLDEQGRPRDVFHTPHVITLPLWMESARRAAEADPYAGLLVSLHVLALSASSRLPAQPATERPFDPDRARERFELNRFQHAQIELQESLRQRLGLRTDLPLHFGLAESAADPREQKLVFDFRLLQAMDFLSLAICCTQPPGQETGPVYLHPGGMMRPLKLRRTTADRLGVNPWPFALARIESTIRYRAIPAGPYRNEQDFHGALAEAPEQTLCCTLSPER